MIPIQAAHGRATDCENRVPPNSPQLRCPRACFCSHALSLDASPAGLPSSTSSSVKPNTLLYATRKSRPVPIIHPARASSPAGAPLSIPHWTSVPETLRGAQDWRAAACGNDRCSFLDSTPLLRSRACLWARAAGQRPWSPRRSASATAGRSCCRR